MNGPNCAFDFTNETVIVSGAARGIGLALAQHFAAAGACVIAIDVDDQILRQETEKIGALAWVADVSSTSDVEGAVAMALERTGRIDVLVNNAGVLRDAVLWKLSDSDWDTVLAVHLGGAFRLTRACVPHFRAQAYGRVINMTSYTGLHGNVGQAAYAAAKAGMIGFTKTAAKELVRFGVTVNAVSPNAETRMVASIPEEKRAEIQSMIPAQRFAQPSEIAAAVAFLASREAGYVTGTVLPVDGGLAM